MKVYLYKGGLSVVEKSGVGSAAFQKMDLSVLQQRRCDFDADFVLQKVADKIWDKKADLPCDQWS